MVTSGSRYWNCGYKSSSASVFHKRSVFYPESQFLSQEDSTYIILSYSTLKLSLKIYSEPQYMSLDVLQLNLSTCHKWRVLTFWVPVSVISDWRVCSKSKWVWPGNLTITYYRPRSVLKVWVLAFVTRCQHRVIVIVITAENLWLEYQYLS